jgi:hypothetical protein
MNKELIIEFESINKISDKKKRNEMLTDFYNRNDLKVKTTQVETKIYIGEKNTIKFNFNKYSFRDVDDPIYRIADDFFSEFNPNLDKTYYEQVNSIFKTKNKISLNDENPVFFYSPELFYLLTTDQPILVKKLQVLVESRSTMHKINTFNWEKESKPIYTEAYLETYIKAFSDGKSDFDNTYSKTIDNIYTLNDKGVIDFVDTLKKKYYPNCSTENALGKCWKYIENKYCNIISHRLIYDFGFYSGKIAQLEKTINNHPVKFKNFYTPFYYAEDVINENVFWRILNEIFIQNTDINLKKDILFNEFKKLDIIPEVGLRQMNFYFKELNKFINGETSLFQGEIENLNDIKIYITNNYTYLIELTDSSIKYIQDLFDSISNTQQTNLLLQEQNLDLSSEEFELELLEINKLENKFWKGIPMDVVVKHFIVLNKQKSKNGDNFLSKKQFISFLKKGFLNDTSQSIQKINCANGEKGIIIKRFYDFFDLAVASFSHKQEKGPFIHLFTSCFDNWEEKTIFHLFKPGKTKNNW